MGGIDGGKERAESTLVTSAVILILVTLKR